MGGTAPRLPSAGGRATLVPMRATVRDVAALAGVSPKTVSNVVNGGLCPCGRATRERVERAGRRARSTCRTCPRAACANGRSCAIALTLPELGSAYSAELAQWFVELAPRARLDGAARPDRTRPRRERDLVSRARAHLVDGLVLNPVSLSASVLAETEGSRRPSSSARSNRSTSTRCTWTAARRTRGHDPPARPRATVGSRSSGPPVRRTPPPRASCATRVTRMRSARSASRSTPPCACRCRRGRRVRRRRGSRPGWTRTRCRTRCSRTRTRSPSACCTSGGTGVHVPEQVSVVGVRRRRRRSLRDPGADDGVVRPAGLRHGGARPAHPTHRRPDAAPETVVVPHRIVERASVAAR